VFVRVVVIARTVVDLAAWMTALDLDRGVTDVKPAAQPGLEVADHMLRIAERAILDDHMTAERHLIR
jgi:hypothetical protein